MMKKTMTAAHSGTPSHMVVLPSNRPAKVTAKENRGWRAIQGSEVEEEALTSVRGASLIQLLTSATSIWMRYECNRPRELDRIRNPEREDSEVVVDVVEHAKQ
jgi:hypothetical protein